MAFSVRFSDVVISNKKIEGSVKIIEQVISKRKIHTREIEGDVFLRPVKTGIEREDLIIYDNHNLRPFEISNPNDDNQVILVLNNAIEICKTIKALHKRNLFIGLLQPQRFWLDENDGLKILGNSLIQNDFDCFDLESSPLENFFYLPPECYHNNDMIPDKRRDFYSLGVVLYYYLSGIHPFNGADKLELMHHHLTSSLIPLDEINQNVSHNLSQLVSVLLSKQPKDRYTSFSGLIKDLEKIEYNYSQGKHDYIELSVNYNPGVIDFGSILFGREDIKQTLRNKFENLDRTGSQLLLINGSSGVGKTSVIEAFSKELSNENCLFLNGKFDQYKQTPYSGLKTAFHLFEQDVLLKSKIAAPLLGQQLLKELGRNVAVLKDMLPNIELLVGELEPIDVLNPIETRNRFNFVFKKFCDVLMDFEFYLLLFIDDWQWCDVPSLELIKYLITSNSQGILYLFAFRGNEIDTSHPFGLFRNEMSPQDFTEEYIIKPLHLSNTNALVSYALNIDKEESKGLAKLIFNKTEGNPFYTKQFLLSLQQNNFLEFDDTKDKWIWDETKIQNEEVSKNVLDLVANNLDKLSFETQIFFKLAAFNGGRFDLRLITEISGFRKDMIIILLDVSAASGHIIRAELPDNTVEYKFVHDRVQQASYQLNIPSFAHSDEKLHFMVGKELFENKCDLQYTKGEIIAHFISSKDLIGETLSNQIIENIIKLGSDVNSSTTPEASKGYYELGLFLNEKFKTQNSTFKLLKGLAESHFLINDMANGEDYSNRAISFSNNNIEKASVLVMKMLFYESYAMFEKNIESGLSALEFLNIEVKGDYNEKTLDGLIETQYNLYKELISNKKTLEDFRKDNMEDEVELVIMDILVNMNASAYFVDLHLFVWSTLKMTNQTLRHGFTDSTPFALVFMGSLLVAYYKDFDKGYDLGKIGVELLNHVESDKYRSRTLSVFPIFIQHFKEPIRNSIIHLDESVYSGLQTGDLPYASYSFYAKVRDAMLVGNNLNKTLSLCDDSIKFMGDIKNQGMQSLMKLLKGSILKLTDGYDDSYKKLEREALKFLLDIKFYTAVSHHYIFRSWVLCILKNFEEAHKLLKLNEEIIIYASSQPHVPKHYFLDSLCIIYQNHELTEEQIDKINTNQGVLEVWADSMPENFKSEYCLIQTLMEIRSGNLERSLQLFNETLKWAELGQFIGAKAVAYDVVSDVFYSSGFELLATSFRQNAQSFYREWNALGKIKDASITYEVSKTEKSDLTTSSLIKATQAISAEVDKESLIKRLLNVVMENAGADKSALVLVEDNTPYVEAEIELGKHQKSLKRKPLIGYKTVPYELIQYVINSKKEFVLDDKGLVNEAYFEKTEVKSAVVMPLIRQKELIGVLYLENSHIAGLFRGNDLEILRIIGAQAAISIYNTFLLETSTGLNVELEASRNELSKMNELLEDKIRDRTKVLRQEIETRKQIEEELKLAKKEADKFHQQQIKEERKDALQAKMMMLSSQMNPHFIFNSLGSVQSFILNSETEKAVDFISEFAGLMRENLENSTTEFISISDEIEFLEKYLYLERIRFNEVFDYKLNVEIENIHDTLIPPMLLQPFIENAIIHGLSKIKDRKGNLDISLKEERDEIICTITDNGVGRAVASTHKRSNHKSVAISNLEARLELLNSNSETKEYQFDIIDLKDGNQAKGTKVLISFPNDLH
ncbi:AAA family ATPase [Aestuariivivens sediminis]|uniref:AAA family ATPase n=1 Tax=Aestuariivivens sediminis TaxID=2913557 RepID=UPI001F57E3D9|nr:AAA family ATPase [Aestuariivivens sediminis]